MASYNLRGERKDRQYNGNMNCAPRGTDAQGSERMKQFLWAGECPEGEEKGPLDVDLERQAWTGERETGLILGRGNSTGDAATAAWGRVPFWTRSRDSGTSSFAQKEGSLRGSARGTGWGWQWDGEEGSDGCKREGRPCRGLHNVKAREEERPRWTVS